VWHRDCDTGSRQYDDNFQQADSTANEEKMKNLLALILGIFVSTAGITPVLAVPGAPPCTLETCTALMTVGSTSASVPLVIAPSGIAQLLDQFTLRDPNTGAFATVSSLTLNPDPAIIFGWGGVSGTGPGDTFFGMQLAVPIALEGLIDAQSAISWDLIQGLGLAGAPDGVTLTPAIHPLTPPGGAASPGSTVLVGYDQPSPNPEIPAFNKGVDVGPQTTGGSPDCDAFVPNAGVGGISSCGPYALTNTFSGTFSSMHMDLGFTLTPNDGFSQSASLVQTQNPIPEPTTLFLLGSGLLGLAGWRLYSSRA
jgi:hypothetical protein